MPLAACARTRFPTGRADRCGRTHAYRLTAAKEEGATIEIEGKKVALGIPQAQGQNSALKYALIPMGRAATPEEAAGGVLL